VIDPDVISNCIFGSTIREGIFAFEVISYLDPKFCTDHETIVEYVYAAFWLLQSKSIWGPNRTLFEFL
jgi:hypothetical protein